MKTLVSLTLAASVALTGSLALAQNSHPAGPGGAPHAGGSHSPPTGAPPPRPGHMGMPGGSSSNGPGM